MRAINHGCSIMEKPMVLAKFLSGNEKETERIIKKTDATTNVGNVDAR
jgi:hypothetical protein